jgi:glycolate oxidase FAD binding subunit
MAQVWSPKNAQDVTAAVGDAIASNITLELVGTGSRRSFGRPVEAQVVLDLSALTGVVDYQPEELVLTVAPATPMAEIETLLASRRQSLAFEPPDFGPLWGLAPGLGTIGGCILVGRGGPRRLSAGAPRDHTLGLKGVNGFGQAFGAGGRVVKNVTGFDLTKLITGSFGTLCALTELTLKVLPAPEDTATIVLAGLADDQAARVMSRALGSPAQVSSAAHLTPETARDSKVAAIAGPATSMTLLRLEGVPPSIEARSDHLRKLLDGVAPQTLLGLAESLAAWKEIADASFFARDLATVVWKLSVSPSAGPTLGYGLAAELGGRCYYDWGGGGVWLELPPAADAHEASVRAMLETVVGGDGHATLMRAPAAVRSAVSPFQPLAPAVDALTRRVQSQFDPNGLFNPGRMYGVR